MCEDDVMSTAPLPLWRFLQPVLHTSPPASTLDGPRRWWTGPLDVEGLAWGAADALLRALSALTPDTRLGLRSNTLAASFDSASRLLINGAASTPFAPLSTFLPTRDGWIRLHANYPHHERALYEALGVSDVDAAVRRVSELSGDELEDAVTRAGGLAAVVRTPAAWASSARAAEISDSPWIRWDTALLAPRAPFVPSGGSRPLQGLRILDLTRVIAGPSASRLLAALGADVLRIDPPRPPEIELQYVDTGFDKRSAIADLTDPTAHEQVAALLPHADGVMLGYRPGALTRSGFDAARLRAEHPHLAVVSIDAWGPSGGRGFDSIVQAATGIAHAYGTGSGDTWRPGALPVQALDHATGLGMAAAMVALIAARPHGLGGSAHLSLARTAMELLAAPAASEPAVALEPVELRVRSSAYGDLSFVPPPVVVNGAQLEYDRAPGVYGSSPLRWAE